MRYLKLYLFLVVFGLKSSMVFAEGICIGLISPDKIVRRETKIHWVSGESLNDLSLYEGRCANAGCKPNPNVLKEKKKQAQEVHLRTNEFQNGLTYVTVHKADGTQVFDATEYVGLKEGTPTFRIPDAVYKLKLPLGFRLTTLLAGKGRRNENSTTTFAEKKFHDSQGGEITINYEITTKAEKNTITGLIVRYRLDEFLITPEKSFEFALDILNGFFRSGKITISNSLGETTLFKFSSSGYLTEALLNKPGIGWKSYPLDSPEVLEILQEYLKVESTDAPVISGSVFDLIMNAAKTETRI
jgi:hypothetical protein